MRIAVPSFISAILIALVLPSAEARTRTVDCGLVCSESVPCGRHLQPTCNSGNPCDSGFVAFTLPDPYRYDCPGFPCSGNTITFTQGCYDPLNPPTCNECSAAGQYQCPSSSGCGGRCDAWLTPDSTGFCTACGGDGEALCQDGEGPCEPGLFAAGEHCYADGCGDSGESACGPLTAGECYAWNNYIPVAHQCVGCGGEFEVTCDDGPRCMPGLQDEFEGILGYDICSDCGGVNERTCLSGAPCREGGAREIGPNTLGLDACGLCGGSDAELACAGSTPCDPGYYHATTAGLSGDIGACVGGGETGHFVEQNGICSPGFPESMTRTAPESWPAQDQAAGGRNTVLILHGRGARCGGTMDDLLDDGGVYQAGHLTYCVEYAQEGVPSIDPRAVRVLPVLDDLLGSPQPSCAATGDCAFDENEPVDEVLAPTFDVPGVALALTQAILRIPIEGEITLIAHSQGGFVARELVYRHYDELRWAGKKIARVITLGHPHFAREVDPHLYTPWLCAPRDSFDCATGKWVWGWDLDVPGSIDDDDYPQIDWTAVSGGGFPGGTSPLDADGDGDTDAADVACLALFGGIYGSPVVGDSSVPIEGSLGYDEFGWFAAAELAHDRKVHTTCTHTAACQFSEAQVEPPPCLPGAGQGSPPDSCQGRDAVPSILPVSTDAPRTPDVLRFDGVDDRVTIDDPAALGALDMGTAMTLEAWVRPLGPGNTANGSGGIIVNKEGEYWLGRWADGRVAWAAADGNWVARLSATVLPEGEWAHVALTFDGAGTGLAKLYVNGVFRQQWTVGASIGDVNTNENRLDIGGRSVGLQPFDGMIDEVRVWNRALAASEVAAVLDGVPTSFTFGPVAWWRFDEAGDTLYDSSGAGFHGSISTLGPAAAPIRRSVRRTDKKGGALYLDGVDDVARIDDPAAMARLEMNNELTIEGWVYLRSYDFATMLVANEGEYWLAVSYDGQIGFAVANTSPGWVGVYSDDHVPLRTWTHLAFVYDNDPATNTGTAKLYVNGALAHEWAVAGPLGQVNAANWLGLGGRGSAGNGIHGLIDEVRIWNIARSASEIAWNYNRTLAAPRSETGLVGYWRFDERYGDVTFDHSGLGNHARLGEGPAATKPYRSMAPHLPGFPLIYAGDCGDGFVDPSETCDDGGTAGADGCSTACRAESVFEIMGQPQGGSVSIEIAGETILVATSAGQTDADVAAAIAAAIQANATLASLGITATSAGDQVFIGGTWSNPVITDPGLMDCATSLAFPSIDGEVMNHCPETGVPLATQTGFATYQWLRDGQPIDGANAPTYTATVTGDYSVRVGDGAGCERDSYPEPTFVTFCPESEISPPGAVFPLRIERDDASPTGYYLGFQSLDGVDGFHLYSGTLGLWYDHGAGAICGLETCGTPGGEGCVDDLGTGELRVVLAPGAGSQYYLVTGYRGTDEGPAGADSSGAPRDPAQQTCPP